MTNLLNQPVAIEEPISPFVVGLSRLKELVEKPVTYGVGELADFVGVTPREVLDWTHGLPGIVWWVEGHRFREFTALLGWLTLHDSPLGPTCADVEIVLPRKGHEQALAKCFGIGPGWVPPGKK